MGENNVQLIEQMLKHTVDDLKEVQADVKDMKKDIETLRQNQTITENTVNQFQMMFKSLERQIRDLQEDWRKKTDEDRRQKEKETKEQIERYEQQERDSRNRWWGFAFLIISTIVLVQLGLR